MYLIYSLDIQHPSLSSSFSWDLTFYKEKSINNIQMKYITLIWKSTCLLYREYYMALSVSHPVPTRDTNIIPRSLARGLKQDVIRKELYHIMFILYLNMRKSCSVLWTFSHMINIILRGMIKGWWYRYQSRQTDTVVMFFQYYICKFPLFSTKYMINYITIYTIFMGHTDF